MTDEQHFDRLEAAIDGEIIGYTESTEERFVPQALHAQKVESGWFEAEDGTQYVALTFTGLPTIVFTVGFAEAVAVEMLEIAEQLRGEAG